MNKKHLFITLLAGLLVVLALGLLPSIDKPVLADTVSEGGEMRGFAWSSNIGWVSFNSVDLPNSSATYSVKINADNTLEGYAWSSNLGWLRFNPDYAGPTEADDPWGAKIVGDKLTGWARFCSVYVSGCSGATKDVNGTELGGWDGWLKMSDVNVRRGSNDQFIFSGFAWGHLNTGWLRMGVNEDPCNEPNPPAYCVTGPPGGGFSVSCSVDPSRASIGELVTWRASVSGGASPYNYVWSRDIASTGDPFNDSSPEVIEDQDSDIKGFTASYDSAGTYIAKVTVNDSGSNSQEVVCNSGNQDGVVISCILDGEPVPEGGSGFTCCNPDSDEDGFCGDQDDSVEDCKVTILGGNRFINYTQDETQRGFNARANFEISDCDTSGLSIGTFTTSGNPVELLSGNFRLVCSDQQSGPFSDCVNLVGGSRYWAWLKPEDSILPSEADSLWFKIKLIGSNNEESGLSPSLWAEYIIQATP